MNVLIVVDMQNDFIDGAPGTEEPIDKPTFGSRYLGALLCAYDEDLRKQGKTGVESVTLIGLCTDICVISNVMLVKAFLPEVPVIVDASCCAGVTPQSHENALNAMEICQIQVLNR
ncbi:MAG: isochorismatase family protein [Dorea sp.]